MRLNAKTGVHPSSLQQLAPAELVRNRDGVFVRPQDMATSDMAELARLTWNQQRQHYDIAETGVDGNAAMPSRLLRLTQSGPNAERFVDADRLRPAQRAVLTQARFVEVAAAPVRPLELVMRENGTFAPGDIVPPAEREGRLRLAWNGSRSRYEIAEHGLPEVQPPSRLVSLGIRGPQANVFVDAGRISEAQQAVLQRHRFVDVCTTPVGRNAATSSRAKSSSKRKRGRTHDDHEPESKQRRLGGLAPQTTVGLNQAANKARHEAEELNPAYARAEALQDRIIDMTIPKPGGSLLEARASGLDASTRVQAAVEILHVRPERHAYRVASAILNMPRGEEKMRCMEKLSPVVGQFPEDLKDRLLHWVEQHAQDSRASRGEQLQGHKFLIVARDHGSATFQSRHEIIFGRLPAAMRREVKQAFLEDMTTSLAERGVNDDWMRDKTSEDTIATVEHDLNLGGEGRYAALQIRRSAYSVRRVLERLDESRLAERAPARASGYAPHAEETDRNRLLSSHRDRDAREGR